MNTSESIGAEIRKIIPKWVDAVKRRDTEAIAEFYAPGARFMVPNAPMAEDHAAIQQMWGNLLSLPNVSLDFGPTFIDAASSGDLAYEVGTYRLGYDKEGRRIEDRGKYVVVWRRIGSSWKAVADILNSDVPPA